MDMPCKAAVSKITGALEKNSVIDVREVGSDLNWFKQLKVTYVQCPAGSFVRGKFFCSLLGCYIEIL